MKLSQTVEGPALRRFMRRWPGGIAVVTTVADRYGRQAVGCTVSAFISVSLRPPLVLVSLAEHSSTLAAVAERQIFCVNVLAESQRELAEQFATASVDRFAGVAYGWEQGVPVLEGTVAAAVCRVDRIVAAADHALVLGVPQWCRQDENADPVVYFEGAYYTLPPHPAQT
jgi:3-hydroxy-9,10-secoandrosta-1,3,5(10)-triene-9,17-dione monooxygenase reductase component